MSDINKFLPLWGIWQIEDQIGKGSFGCVYKAFREEFGKKYYCAIKHISVPRDEDEVREFLKDNMTDDPSVASEYYHQLASDITNEINTMYSLNGYTNIVTYQEHLILPKESGVGFDIFIKMELLTELSDAVREQSLTQQEVVQLGIDICTALEVCAAKKLIHRDIKPQNIFVSETGNYKLGDFGISRPLEKTTSGLSKKGTYSYMAPEVYKGDEYGASVDIYSLGLVMYRLLNGNRLPFLPLAPTPVRYDDNDKALARRMKGEDISAPAFADEALSAVILKMIAFDRSKRYKTALEAKAALLVLGTSDKVVPMVAPVGKNSLTDDEGEKTESIFASDEFDDDDEKTVGMHDAVPAPVFVPVAPPVPEVPAVATAPAPAPAKKPLGKIVIAVLAAVVVVIVAVVVLLNQGGVDDDDPDGPTEDVYGNLTEEDMWTLGDDFWTLWTDSTEEATEEPDITTTTFASQEQMMTTSTTQAPTTTSKLTTTKSLATGTPQLVTGITIPASKTGDSCEWIAIAQQGGYYLILRSTYIMFSTFGSNSSYKGSTAQREINTWFNNLSSSTGLRKFAVESDAINKIGNIGVNDSSGLSIPYAQAPTPSNPVPDTAFLLSYQEAIRYCSAKWYNSPRDEYQESSSGAVANWSALPELRNPNITYIGSIPVYDTFWFIRTPGGHANTVSGVHTTGELSVFCNPSASLALRPALWVEASILN